MKKSKKSQKKSNINRAPWKMTNENIKLYNVSRKQTNRPPIGPYPPEKFWTSDYNYGSWKKSK